MNPPFNGEHLYGFATFLFTTDGDASPIMCAGSTKPSKVVVSGGQFLGYVHNP